MQMTSTMQGDGRERTKLPALYDGIAKAHRTAEDGADHEVAKYGETCEGSDTDAY
jgi:hypothetical protein